MRMGRASPGVYLPEGHVGRPSVRRCCMLKLIPEAQPSIRGIDSGDSLKSYGWTTRLVTIPRDFYPVDVDVSGTSKELHRFDQRELDPFLGYSFRKTTDPQVLQFLFALQATSKGPRAKTGCNIIPPDHSHPQDGFEYIRGNYFPIGYYNKIVGFPGPMG